MGRTNFEIPLLIHHLLPKGSDLGIAPIFAARAMRGFADGFVAVLLPVYLLEMGLGGVEVGAIAWPTSARTGSFRYMAHTAAPTIP